MTISQLQQNGENFLASLKNTPVTNTEESILLRILVQVLVIVGIIATDIAAQTQTNFWAIPISIVGAVWSWRQRKKRNIGVKFLLAIGMLLVLAIFLSNLVVNLQDSRIALANLLIQLQVLHSFDVPRRKDLGYSMVIGLILIGVAGTISQTLIFAPFLLIFLALALPALVLDYRSRLGLASVERPSFASGSLLKSFPLSARRLGQFLGTIVLLGLLLFAIMPRFSGYQLQTFPVSSPVDFENQSFNAQNRDIVNPGYVKEGIDRGQRQTNIPSNGSGNVDDTFYYGFNSKMSQNLRGTMKPQIVMRVRSQAPGFWRVLGFDRYTGQGWEISRDEKLDNLKRYPWSYRFSLDLPFTKAKTKEIIQSYTLVSDLPNLIPVLSSPQYLFFPTREIVLDSENSIRSPGGLVQGLTYTAISQVPYRDKTALQTTSESYHSSIQDHYLQIPPQIAEKIRTQAEKLLSKSPQPLTSAYDKALFLAQALKQNYEIKSDLPFLAKNEDLVEAFLFHYQGGYNDHFSSTLTIMLRSLGIPARLAVGFAPGQFNPFTGFYVVRNTDAYALTEVYFPDYGWFAFDPIPGHELFPPSFEESQVFSVLKQFWHWVAGWMPSPVVSFLSILWTNIIGRLFEILSGLWRFIYSGLVGALFGIMLAILLGFTMWLGWKQLYHWGDRRRLSQLPPMERLYRQMLKTLQERGYSKHPAQTPLEFASNLHQHQPQVVVSMIEEISSAYVCWRYGEKSPDLEYFLQRFKELKKSMQI